MKKINFVWAALLLSFSANASLQTVKINIKTAQAPRWMYNKGDKFHFDGHAKSLQEIKLALIEERYVDCLKLIDRENLTDKALHSWLLLNESHCVLGQFQKGKASIDRLKRLVDKIDAEPALIFSGSTKDLMIKEYMELLYSLLQMQTKSQRTSAWATFEKLLELKSWQDSDKMALVYKSGGELAFVQQDFVLAYELYSRSLSLHDDDEIKKRVNALRDTLIERKAIAGANDIKTKSDNVSLVASERENKLYQRFTTSVAAGDLLPAVEDGVSLLQEFPAGSRANEIADKIIQIYINVQSKTEVHFNSLKKSLRNTFDGLSVDWIYPWSRQLYYRGFYREAFDLVSVAFEKADKSRSIGKVSLLSGMAALETGQYKDAEKSFRKAIEQAAGSDEATEAIFRLGLLKFRMKDYSDSAAQFEKLNAAHPNSKYTLQAKYWLYRCLQTLDTVRADALAKAIVAEYPLTYYGLRIRGEQNKNILLLNVNPNAPVEFEMKLTNSENIVYEKIMLLLSAGWFEEAQSEIDHLPEPKSVEAKMIRVKLLSMAFSFEKANSLLNEIWKEAPQMMGLDSIRMVYPKEFAFYIDKNKGNEQIDSNLITALIKQESSFNPKATSPAGANGLMQLLTGTAKEIAERLRMKELKYPDDLYNPELNVKLGIRYLAQMGRAFNGHLPLALAAYNAGIGKVRNWMSQRDEMKNLAQVHTSQIENEIWIDELPWDETSFYVKSILRNFLIYSLLDKGQVELKDPIWQMGLAKP